MLGGRIDKGARTVVHAAERFYTDMYKQVSRYQNSWKVNRLQLKETLSNSSDTRPFTDTTATPRPSSHCQLKRAGMSNMVTFLS